MSSELPNYYLEGIDHLSSGFQRMGCECGYSQGANQAGWDDDTDELREEDVWGGGHGNSYKLAYEEATEYKMDNGHTMKKGKGLISRLSMELRAVGVKGRKKGCSGVGLADLDAMQNGGYGGTGDSYDGWAPGFSVRKVKIPLVSDGEGDSRYRSRWHDSETSGNGGGVPQSAPVSMPVWPAKCGFGDLNGYVDADDSSSRCEDDYQDNEDSDDDNDRMDSERRRLAPHEIVDLEYAQSRPTTFSVIEGAGRTLKGSDLRRVRNAVWSCTGFED